MYQQLNAFLVWEACKLQRLSGDLTKIFFQFLKCSKLRLLAWKSRTNVANLTELSGMSYVNLLYVPHHVFTYICFSYFAPIVTTCILFICTFCSYGLYLIGNSTDRCWWGRETFSMNYMMDNIYLIYDLPTKWSVRLTLREPLIPGLLI
jgi:hypothetical protein